MDLSGKTFGQYRIMRLLGRGGMGEVYEAEHRVLQRRYALKLLPEDFAGRSEAVARFRQEAKVMANLEHPHIVRVDEFGETDGRYWLRMELVHGVEHSTFNIQHSTSNVEQPRCITLGDYAAQRGGKIEQGEFAVILRQILEALAYAHGKGVVHRDLKPGNILLEKDAAGVLHVKVSDFGLARVIGEEFIRSQAQISVSRSIGEARTLGAEKSLGDEKTLREEEGTSTRALLGTWEYMSPEQRRGEEADTRSDVYAMGLMCYRLLTGGELGVRLPSQLDKALNPAWDEFVAKALELKPAARYADGREMLAAFAAVGVAPVAASLASAANIKSEVSGALPRRRYGVMVAVAVVVFSLMGIGGWYLGVYLPKQKRQTAMVQQQTAAKAADDKARAEAEAARLAEEKRKADESATQQAAANKAAQELAAKQVAEEKAKAAAEQKRLADEAERLANAKGGLLLKTVPSGAMVTLGGEDVQQSPATFKGVKIGKYPMRVSLDGYEPVSREVEIKENDFADLGTIELVHETGSVRIESEPSGALVKRGNEELGKTPLELAAVPTGEVKYELALTGYQKTNVGGTVKHKETLQLSLVLPLDEARDALTGVTVQDLDAKIRRQFQVPADVQGAIVTGIDRDSNPFDAGLRQNDVIVEINRQPVAGSNDSMRLCKSAKEDQILIKIWRQSGNSEGRSAAGSLFGAAVAVVSHGSTLFLNVDNTKRVKHPTGSY